MNLTLFDAAQGVREALATVDPETGEYTEAYTESRALFVEKGAACVAYAVEEAAAIEAAEKMLKAMSERVAARKAMNERFKAYMADCMKATGVHKLTLDGLISATLYEGRDESIEIDADAEFPPELCNEPKPPVPSRTRIKAAILAGQPVAGARIIRKDRLTIK